MQTEKRSSSQGATWGLAILFGVVGVSIQQNVGGFFVGAALGGLLAQVLHLRSRTEALNQQLRALTQRLADFKAAPEASATTPSATPEPTPLPAPRPAPASPTAPRPVARTETLLSQPLPAPQPAPPSTPTPVDRAIAGFIAWLA